MCVCILIHRFIDFIENVSMRRFNVDIMILYISGLDYARKLKFSSNVHLPSINKMLQYRYA